MPEMSKVADTQYEMPDYSDYDDFSELHEDEKEELRKLKEESKQVNIQDGDVVGLLVKGHVADGYAYYRIIDDDPLTFQHVPYGDAYSLPKQTIRGTVKQDVLESARRAESSKMSGGWPDVLR